MTVRDRIVRALESAGTDAHRSAPRTPTAGAAWPEWRRTGFAIRAGACVAQESEWWVYLVVPAIPDPDALDVALDTLAGDLALEGVVVDSAEPVSLVLETGSNPVPAVRWSVRARP